MSEYLFFFTIGPVKDFIADSRKAQDLFAGSALLSYLTDIAIKKGIELFKQGDEIIITPKIDTDFKPNRFVAKINGTDKQNKTIGESIEKTVKKAFADIGNLPFNLRLQKPDGFDEQIANYLEINWLFYPLAGISYNQAYKRVFQELAAIKNVHAFTNTEKTGRKCSVDGKLILKVYRKNSKLVNGNLIDEAITLNSNNKYGKLYIEKPEVTLLAHNDEKILKIWHIQEGEGLSAVSLTKRIFNPEKPTELSKPHLFPSTAKVSLMNLLDKIRQLDEYKAYQDVIYGKELLSHSDEQLFYKDNIKQIIDKVDPSKTQEVCDLHENLTNAMKREGISDPFTKYYALIRFDGDHMGDWLTGIGLKEDIDLEIFHGIFTECVHNFASQIYEFIQEPRGSVIYAGGEDFMAMINIHHLFEVMRAIQKVYEEEISDKLVTYRKPEAGEMTISLGVAIAHYKQPLPMVLDRAKEMESKAKNSGRNRFTVGVMKHSGNSLETSYQWYVDTCDTLTIIEDIFESIQNDSFSTAFLRNLYDVFENYGLTISKELIESKIKLYIPRAANMKDKNMIENLIEKVKALLTITADNKQEDFANLLLILDFLIRKNRD